MMDSNHHNGIDRLLADQKRLSRLRRGRIGLLSNQTCRTASGQTTAAALQTALAGATGRGLIRLFAAEHGWSTTTAPGASVGDARDPETGLPVHSVYGIRQRPDRKMFEDLDAILIDLRDIGVRCYTYATTAARFIAALTGQAPAVILCDRPNPIGNRQAGPDLDPTLRNFLAFLDAPFVHGRTLGGLLTDFNHALGPAACDLTVVPAGEPAPAPAWVPPSPSLTHPDTLTL